MMRILFWQQTERAHMKPDMFVCFLLIATCSPFISRLGEFYYAAISQRPVYRVANPAYSSTKEHDLPEYMVKIDLLVRCGSFRTWTDPEGRFVLGPAAHYWAAAHPFVSASSSQQILKFEAHESTSVGYVEL